MSLFDQNVNDLSDKIFDLNNDGKLDSGEQAFMYETYNQTMNKPNDEHIDKAPGKDNIEKKASVASGVLYVAAAIVILVILAVSCVGSV